MSMSMSISISNRMQGWSRGGRPRNHIRTRKACRAQARSTADSGQGSQRVTQCACWIARPYMLHPIKHPMVGTRVAFGGCFWCCVLVLFCGWCSVVCLSVGLRLVVYCTVYCQSVQARGMCRVQKQRSNSAVVRPTPALSAALRTPHGRAAVRARDAVRGRDRVARVVPFSFELAVSRPMCNDHATIVCSVVYCTYVV